MISELTYLEVVFLILLPIAVGIPLTKWAGDAAKRRGSSPLVVRTLRIVITVVWVVIALVGVSVAFAPFNPLSGLTVSAVGAIVVSLALQTTLQNMIAGVFLLRGRFLRLGDVVQFSGVKGTVVSIGLIEVVLKLDGGALVLVSNSNLIGGPMINFTAPVRLAGEY